MLNNHKVYVDEFCELYEMIQIFMDESFWSYEKLKPDISSVVVFSRQTFAKHANDIKNHVANGRYHAVLANPTEGSITLKHQLITTDTLDLAREKKLILIGCGDMEPGIANLLYDAYLPKCYDYSENLLAAEQCSTLSLAKPYSFLYLNGRYRAHRNYLLQCLNNEDLLANALWSNLDSAAAPIRTLPEQYEHPRYQQNLNCGTTGFVKDSLFGGEWGEIYIHADQYINTYFSLVAETVFDYPYSLRSEKTYKPIAAGHPFVIAANRGFYRDLHAIGFRTFGHLIDESFDMIDNSEDRLKRIVQVVKDLCASDLDEFAVACESTTKYNKQHMATLGPELRSRFPDQFRDFVTTNFNL